MEFIPDFPLTQSTNDFPVTQSTSLLDTPVKPKRSRTEKPAMDSVKVNLFKRPKKEAKTETKPHPRMTFVHQGSSVYKIGYEKFVHVAWISGETKVTLAEWIQQSDGAWIMTPNRSISLNKTNFLRLSGLIMTGKANLDPTACVPGIDNGKLSPLYCLDDDLYFGWNRYNCTNLATVRKFLLTSKKDLMPTKVGLSFGEKCYEGIKELVLDFQLLQDILAVDDAHRVVKTDKPGLTYNLLQSELAEIMFRIVREHRENQTFPVPMRGTSTDEEWNTAEKEVLEKKLLEGALLMADQLDVHQVLSIDVKGYMENARKEVRELFDKMLL